MRKAEINALMRAHKNRARPVAFFHILRRPSLEADDQAFLLAHIHELGGVDLLRWKARCGKGEAGVIIRRLAQMAKAEPVQFQHEVLQPMSLSLTEKEWIELADQLRGQVPPSLWERIEARGKEDPLPARAAPAPETFDLASLGLDDDGGGSGGFFADFGDDILGDEGSSKGEHTKYTSRVLAAIEALGALSPDAFRAAFTDAMERLTTGELLELHEAAPHLLHEGELADIVLARAGRPDEDWSAILETFPIQLEDAVLEKLRRTPRDEERAGLLEWLGQNATPPKMVLEAVLQSMQKGDLRQGTLPWLARTLATKSAWEKNGAKILFALVDRKAFGEMSELVTLVWSQADWSSSKRARKGRKSALSAAQKELLEAVHFGFAWTLIPMALGALERDNDGQAMGALSALACLTPPTKVSRALRALRKSPRAKGDVLALVEMNERLVKHSDPADASFEGIVAAIHVLADAST